MDLMQGEEVIWSGHPTWRGTLGWYVRAVPVVLIPIVVVYVLRALDRTGRRFFGSVPPNHAAWRCGDSAETGSSYYCGT